MAEGCAYPGFEYETERGAHAVPIEFRSLAPIGRSSDPPDAAPLGALSPPETPPEDPPTSTSIFTPSPPLEGVPLPDRCRADGCGDGGAAVSSADDQQGPIQDSSLGTGTDPSGSSGGVWDHCLDYCNGGPFFRSDGEEVEEGLGVSVLARYTGIGGRAAAVKCLVGKGVAVLCGTHPELSPHWLEAACRFEAEAAAASGNSKPGQAALVKSKLESSHDGRVRFWRMLLSEARFC